MTRPTGQIADKARVTTEPRILPCQCANVVDTGPEEADEVNKMLGAELRGARRMAGVSQDTLGAAVGLSGSEVGTRRAWRVPWFTIVHAARLSERRGSRPLGARFPGGPPLRDAAHLHSLARFEARLPASLRCHREWPIPTSTDRRAIDLLITGLTRPWGSRRRRYWMTFQALERAINLKRRDSGLERMILLVRDSVRNREILGSADALRRSSP